MNVDKAKLGNRINEIRIKRKQTLEEFANSIKESTQGKIKTTKSNASKWEKGKNVPNDITLKAIAELGGMSVKELLYGSPSEYIYDVISQEMRADFVFKTNISKFIDDKEFQCKVNLKQQQILLSKIEEFIEKTLIQDFYSLSTEELTKHFLHYLRYEGEPVKDLEGIEFTPSYLVGYKHQFILHKEEGSRPSQSQRKYTILSLEKEGYPLIYMGFRSIIEEHANVINIHIDQLTHKKTFHELKELGEDFIYVTLDEYFDAFIGIDHKFKEKFFDDWIKYIEYNKSNKPIHLFFADSELPSSKFYKY